MAAEFVTVARLRAEMATILARLDRDAPLYVTQRGQARAVLLDVDAYRALVEQLEHLDDAVEALLARERRERGEPVRPLADVIRGRSARITSQTKRAPRRPRARVPG